MFSSDLYEQQMGVRHYHYFLAPGVGLYLGMISVHFEPVLNEYEIVINIGLRNLKRKYAYMSRLFKWKLRQ